jgi:tRNA nucleotidyltransferase (CCA-adding enzyme)
MKATESTRWEHFPHGADIGVRGVAPTLAGAFEQAALALTAIVIEPEDLEPEEEVELACDAPDHELLLIDWLNLVIYEMATRRMLFGRYEVAIEGSRLVARAFGQPIDAEKQELTVEPKGATYTALSVRRLNDGGWCAECVVDV